MNKYVLAVDLGTTGNRAILFDHSERIVKKAYQEFTQIFPKPGWVEHDPEEIWKSTFHVIKSVLAGINPSQIAALGLTNQRETTVVWDKRTGKPVMNAIVWQCRRTQAECEALKRAGWSAKIKSKTGLVIDSYFSATKLAWILKHVKNAKKRAQAGELLFGTIDSWIIWKLTDGRLHVTDVSNASRTMLYNIRTLKWDTELCKKFGVPISMLPKVVDSSGVVGKVSCKGLPNISIAGIVGDQQGAMFAQGCYAPGIVKNTYGTGLFLQMNTKKKLLYSKDLLTTIAWKIGEEVDYALEGSVFIGGACIQWLRDGLKIIKHASDTQKLAKSLSSNEGVYFVPALVGLGAPYWDSTARGAFFGITRGTNEKHFARAALEAICYQTKDVALSMEKTIRTSIKRVQVDGGAVANDFLMQLQADILGCEVERPKVIETTALGAAGLAGIAVGFWKDKSEFLSKRSTERVFHPKINNAERKLLYDKWLDAVRRTQKWLK